MDNKSIIRLIRHSVALMELHGESDSKIKAYNNALFNLERETNALSEMSCVELEEINGVGKSIAAAIEEICKTGTSTTIEKLTGETPEGVIEMLDIKGIGAKKIRQLWKELDIESCDALLQAIDEGKLAKLKGFGEKTQANLKEAILYKRQHAGKVLYAEAEVLMNFLKKNITEHFPDILISESGAFRRRVEIIDELTLVIGSENINAVNAYINTIDGLTYLKKQSSPFNWRGTFEGANLPVRIRFTSRSEFYKILFITTGSNVHIHHPINEDDSLYSLIKSSADIPSEQAIYDLAELPFIEPEIREGQFEFESATNNALPQLIKMKDLKGILHNHSTYSDGKHSIEEMARYCKELGYEYLGISDHSKSSFYYANGLYENRVKDQQKEIDELNIAMAPFRIFKGIECDILPDGTLDYDNDTLATFDFIVASIHSVLNMDIQKATQRLVTAIENPFTTILGHMTGRLLLQRDGYPVDHKAIIDACAKNNVVIEVNAHPRRLDIDWRWIYYALQKGVMLSINPDAHAREGYHDMRYGILAARKGGLTKDMNLNSLTLSEIDQYFRNKKERALEAVT
ncbi:DNA polymerase X family [Fulvivirga imtechensis AK7]|uniref:DNA polymerase X family n=1 Tax=Fulvivirga imtechensis AK7 TaxID=1237149 RepID=L8JIT4_9BACT|nr:DNA polymerase/3'-5' exonuclease PolX [Fulvivirga imtechensis]ELR68771.1 DNA polymerase X family [Fulvivirga imtechensis AK7]